MEKHYNVGKNNWNYGKNHSGKKNGNYKTGKYCKRTCYCKECHKRITGVGKTGLCSSCAISGKRHRDYIDGRSLKKYYCKDCRRRITMGSKNGRCRSCAHKGKLNNMAGKFGRVYITGRTIIRHHIDLNTSNNKKDNILKITSRVHTSLHHRAYNYLVKQGLIKKYIKWFFKYEIRKIKRG